MSGRVVALATCSALPRLHPDDHGLVPALRELGIEARPVVWDAPDARWREFSAVVIRSCWDYTGKLPQFLDWIARLESLGVQVWNPPAVLRWNTRKTYLRDLEARGVPVVPTEWIDGGDFAALDRAVADATGRSGPAPASSGGRVIKPAVDAAGRAAFRFWPGMSSGEWAASLQVLRGALASSPLLVQPFLREIEEEGEWSFLFFGRRFSHAVLKRPAQGEFRVQEAFGGTFSGLQPPAEWIRQAESVLMAVPEDLLYARVDMIPVQGRLLLGELEVTEPSLFFSVAPGAERAFAGALLDELNDELNKSCVQGG